MKRCTPPAVAAASIASVPSTFPRIEDGFAGRADDAGNVNDCVRFRDEALQGCAIVETSGNSTQPRHEMAVRGG